jgi:RNA polymerase sigma-70 factor, ECF subfamily
VYNIARHFTRDADLKIVIFAARFEQRDGAECVDMPSDEVPTDLSSKTQASFEIDHATRLQIRKVRQPSCFFEDIEAQRIRVRLDGREAAAIDGNAVAGRQVHERRARRDGENPSSGLRLEAKDVPGFLHDACEHVPRSNRETPLRQAANANCRAHRHSLCVRSVAELARNQRPETLSLLPVADAAETLSPEAERELVRRAQEGNEDAFGQLMRQHYEQTFRLVQSMVRDEHAARDVCQDVWLTVWKNLAKFRGDAKFSTWVHPIAVRRAIDHLRSRKRWLGRFIPFATEQTDADLPGVPEAAAEGDPRQDMEKSERSNRFERAIASLPPKHRAVLALREVQGLSYEEIAKTLECRRGTVMSRLFHARRLLAQKLGELPCE